MTTKKILFATDFSEASDQALRWAAALARGLHAKLVVLHVEPGQPTKEFGSVYAGLPDPGIAQIAQKLAKINVERAESPCEHRIRAGDPATEILAEAQEQDAEAIVMGSHGRSGVRRLLMGSVAEDVLRNAHRPVMVCRP